MNLRDARIKTVDEVLKREIRSGDALKELLFIYWGGHGIIAGDKRALLSADATAESLCGLDLNSLLFSLRTEHYPFTRQVVVVDSCATHFPNEREADLRTFPQKALLGDKRQFVLYSAADAEAARDGLFSPVVLEWLETSAGGQWPPNLDQLADHVKAHFNRNLRESGSQTPIAAW